MVQTLVAIDDERYFVSSEKYHLHGYVFYSDGDRGNQKGIRGESFDHLVLYDFESIV
jgi:hypothetical protein